MRRIKQIKRILPVVICLVILFACAPAGLANESGNAKFNISHVQLLNPLNNEEIDSVKGQAGYRVQAQIENNGNETADGLVIVQVRQGAGAAPESGGRVLNCVGVSSAIPATGSAVTSDDILPSGLSGKAYVDVFVWDGWNDQVPLADANHKSFAITN